MKRPSSKARGKAKRSFPFKFKSHKVDFAKFKSHPAETEIAKLTLPGVGNKLRPSVPIEVLSPTKTLGRGETYFHLNTPYGFLPYSWSFETPPLVPFVRKGGVQVYPTIQSPPYAAFWGRGSIQARFDPIAYGITSVATYVITFNIETYPGAAQFRLY